jgi:YVTN family beta-propeller protein
VAATDVASGALTKAVLTVPLADVSGNYLLGQPVVTPNGSYVYVAASSKNSVLMLNASTNKVTGTPIPTGNDPIYMAVAANGKRLYVGNNNDGTVTVVDITQQSGPSRLRLAENDPRFAHIIRRDLDLYFIPRNDADKVLPHLSADMGENFLAVRQRHPKHRIR